MIRCTRPPSVEGYADMTSEMSSSISSSYLQARSSLSNSQVANEKLLESLDTAWLGPKKSLEAVVQYSDALVGLVEAGKNGQEAANSLGSGLSTLAATIGLSVPGGAAVVALKELATTAYGEIAALKSTKRLHQAIKLAEPAILKVSEIISADLDDLQKIVTQTGIQLQAELEDKNEQMIEYFESLVLRDANVIRELTAITQYQNYQYQDQDELDENHALLSGIRGGEVHPDSTNNPAAVERRRKVLMDQLTDVRKEIQIYRPDYDAVQEELRIIKEAIATNLELIEKSKETLRVWARTHKKLHQSLENKKPFNIREFERVIKEVSDIYSNYKESK